MVLPSLGKDILQDNDYGYILRRWAQMLSDREDRLTYNLISAIYGVHSPEFAREIYDDTYAQLYDLPFKVKMQKAIELYKKIEGSWKSE